MVLGDGQAVLEPRHVAGGRAGHGAPEDAGLPEKDHAGFWHPAEGNLAWGIKKRQVEYAENV